MPSLACNTQVKESGDGCSLSINARHVLSVGTSSTPPTAIKGRPPEDIDVVLTADLVLSFAAAADGHPVSGPCLRASSCLRHVLSYLRANEHQLGLGMISNLFVDGDDRPKVTVSSAGSYGLPVGLKDSGCPTLALEAIDITFAFKSNDRATDVFSERAYLPFTSILDRAMQRFVTLHLVKRYPLIFGGWRRRVDSELAYMISMSKSMLNIIERSTNAKFRKRTKKLFTVSERGLDLASSQSRRKLEEYANLPELTKTDAKGDISREDTLTQSMARLLKLSVRPSWSKVLVSSSTPNVHCEHDELRIHSEESAFSSDGPPPASKVVTHDLCWDDLPSLSRRSPPAPSFCENGVEENEQEFLDWGDSPARNCDDAFMDECQVTEDDLDIAMDDPVNLDISDEDRLYEDDCWLAEDIDHVADDDFPCWLPSDSELDYRRKLSPTSPVPSDDEFDLPSSQSQDEHLTTPQDSQSFPLEHADDFDSSYLETCLSVHHEVTTTQEPLNICGSVPALCEQASMEEAYPIMLHDFEEADNSLIGEDVFRPLDAAANDHLVLDDF